METVPSYWKKGQRKERLKILPFHYTTPAGPNGAQEEERPLFAPRRTLAKRPPRTCPRLRRPKARTHPGASDARVAAARGETGVCRARGGPAGRTDRGLRRTDGGHTPGRAGPRHQSGSVKITKGKGWRGERTRIVPSGDITRAARCFSLRGALTFPPVY